MIELTEDTGQSRFHILDSDVPNMCAAWSLAYRHTDVLPTLFGMKDTVAAHSALGVVLDYIEHHPPVGALD